MEYKETVKKVIAEVCRLLLGVVFIFSGTVKAVDPMGGAIKIGDYLTSFGLDKLQPFTVLISFNLSALEFMLGVCMLLGVYRRTGNENPANEYFAGFYIFESNATKCRQTHITRSLFGAPCVSEKTGTPNKDSMRCIT